jgi:hemoglobin
MDQRAIACFDQALKDVGVASDERFQRALHDCFAWATTVTMSCHHDSAGDLPDGLHIPKRSWRGFVSDAKTDDSRRFVRVAPLVPSHLTAFFMSARMSAP